MFEKIISYLSSEISSVLTVGALCVSFFLGAYGSHLYYSNVISQAQAAQARAVAEQKADHEKSLNDATNTILLAQTQYDAVRAERDNLLTRLRQQSNNMRSNTDTGNAAAAGTATCQKLVGELSQLAAQCQDGWQRCATKHDALSKIHQ